MAVQNAHNPRRFMGWDFTFSAPKAVSVLYAAADPETRKVIEDAVREAALAAFQRHIAPRLYSRTGHGGAGEIVPASGVVIAYVQHLSRANDPQLHVHVIAPSLSRGPDGAIRTIEAHEALKTKLLGGAAFRLEIATGLEERLRVAFHLDREGRAHIREIDPALERFFSQRTEQIEQTLQARLGPDAWTEASAAQKMAAAVASRPPHDRSYREDWDLRVRAQQDPGLAAAWERAREAARARGTGAARDRDQMLAGLDRIIRESARDVVMGGARSAVTGRRLYGRAVADERAILAEAMARAIGSGATPADVESRWRVAQARGDVIVLADRRGGGAARVTTPEMAEVERELERAWRQLLARDGFGLDRRTVADAARRWELEHATELSEDQRAAIDAATRGTAAAVIEGLAGTGKSSVMDVIRAAYEEAGYRVAGVATAGLVAEQMRRLGIDSMTAARAILGGLAPDSRTVIVMDEAAATNSVTMRGVLRLAQEAGAKVILVGDPLQARPVGPGDPFEALAVLAAQAGASSRLEQVVRQTSDPIVVGERAARALGSQDAQEVREHVRRVVEAGGGLRDVLEQAQGLGEAARSALEEAVRRAQAAREVAELAAQGRAGDALRAADAHGWVQTHASRESALGAAAHEVAEALLEGRTSIAVTTTRADAAAINAAVREELRAAGRLGEDVEFREPFGEGRVRLAVGDVVSFTAPFAFEGVANGQRGVVVEASPAGVDVRLEDGRVVSVWGLEAARETESGYTLLTHDYARTVQRGGQGVTVDHAVAAFSAESAGLDARTGDVMGTRHREDMTYVVYSETAAAERAHAEWEPGHWPRGGEQARLRPEEHAAVVEEAAARMDRSAPAETTLRDDYQEAIRRAQDPSRSRADECEAAARDARRAAEETREEARRWHRQEKAGDERTPQDAEARDEQARRGRGREERPDERGAGAWQDQRSGKREETGGEPRQDDRAKARREERPESERQEQGRPPGRGEYPEDIRKAAERAHQAERAAEQAAERARQAEERAERDRRDPSASPARRAESHHAASQAHGEHRRAERDAAIAERDLAGRLRDAGYEREAEQAMDRARRAEERAEFAGIREDLRERQAAGFEREQERERGASRPDQPARQAEERADAYGGRQRE
jgi:conjugative relaxase-like TrwC/TraI family protein